MATKEFRSGDAVRVRDFPYPCKVNYVDERGRVHLIVYKDNHPFKMVSLASAVSFAERPNITV